MSDSCPLPIDWLDYLEGKKPAEMKDHLRNCPSCREVLSLLSKQAGNVPSQAWAKHLASLNDARLTEEKAPRPAPAELWFSSGEWTLHDTEYRPPERSLVLVLSEDSQGVGGHSWYDVAPVRTDVEEALPTDLLLAAEESSLNCSLRVVLTFECKVERRQLESRVGSLADINIVFSALSDKTQAWRWGNPLESQEDQRLWWEPDFAETMAALRGPWLQYLDGAERISEVSPQPVEAEILTFVPKEWVEAVDERELVAASSNDQKKTLWELESAHLQMTGSFEVDWEQERLFFSIHSYHTERPLRLRLLLYLKGNEKPEESEEFELAQDRCVSWDLVRTPEEVDRLGARVAG
jgi:hypothetical protein